MSRTYKREHRSNLSQNGQRGHHNTLTREFKGLGLVGFMVKDCRNLLDQRDLKSDRLGELRHEGTKKRRNFLKRQARKEIESGI